MSASNHTITIEPTTVYPGGINQLAVVERYNGRIITVCCREDQIPAGRTLTQYAHRYADMYAAVYVAEGGAR